MKKIIALALGAVLCIGLLAGCGNSAADPTPTPTTAPTQTTEPTPSEDPAPTGEEPAPTGDETSASYANAITGARSDQENTDRPITTTAEEFGEIGWQTLGITAEDVDAFAVSMSFMNVQAYCVGIFKPAEGKAETVMNGLQAYIDNTVQSFTNYLPDQLTIAENARLEQLDDGTIVLVMCENQDTVYDSIVAAL